MIARAGSETTTTTATATATTRTTTATLTAMNETTTVATMTTTTTTTARDGLRLHRRRRRRRCRWKRRRLPCSMMISLAAMSAEAARRPSGRPAVVRASIHPSCKSVVGAAPSETSGRSPARSLARSATRLGSTSNQSKYCITTTPPSPHVTRAGQRLFTFT
jgi:hypothetical protein